MVIIEIDGVSSHDIPVSDVIRVISDAVQIPLSLDNLPEGIASLSQSHLGLKFTIPVDCQLYVAIVRQVLNMIEHREKKAALWVPIT
jgi:hypothetical protein